MTVLLLSLLANAAPAERAALPDTPVVAPGLSPDSTARLQLAVKFRHDLRARASDGQVTALQALPGVDAVASQHGLTFRGAFPDDAAIAGLLARAEARSGRAQPDLPGIHYVDGPHGPAALEAAGEALRALPAVEAAWVEVQGVRPPGVDIDPATPDYTGEQRWLDPDPGLDFAAGWAAGFTGAGVRVSNIEYDFLPTHEDLPEIVVEPDQTPESFFAPDHGTATLGEVLSEDNGFGMTGGAHGATGAFYTEWSVEDGYRRPTAIANACADGVAGDIVMLEMQAFGVGPGDAYVPAEYDLGVWEAVRVCADADVVVIGAAGNGTQDLDDPAYADYMARGDSGGIIVGAGTGGWDGLHDAEGFSTYGSRVDVQGWGSIVATLAYGDLAFLDGDVRQAYTGFFSGTSSATPLVVAAAAVLQQAAIARSGRPLTPPAMKELLQSTGVPQGSSAAATPIGPLPDVAAALDALSDPDGDGYFGFWDDCDDDDGSVNPDGVEVFNGVDDDCNGLIDDLAVWTDLGGGLSGDTTPTLIAAGPGTPGSPFDLIVDGAPPFTDVLLIGSRDRGDVPMLGGVSIPQNRFHANLGATDGDGHFATTLTLPPALVADDTLYLQVWLQDAGGPAGFVATNAFLLTVESGD